MELTVEYWWNILRLPVAAIIAVVWWLLLIRKRKVGNYQKQREKVEAEEIVTPEPQPEKPAQPVESQPPIKTKAKKSPKKFTRTIADQVPLIATDTISTTSDIHIFYASQFNHTSSLAKHLLTFLPEYTRLHDISVIPNLDDYFLQHPSNAFYFLLLPSYANDSGPTQISLKR